MIDVEINRLKIESVHSTLDNRIAYKEFTVKSENNKK